MRLPTVLAALLVALATTSSPTAAQPAPGPAIRSVTLEPDTGVIRISGTGLGPDLTVVVDGQPVTALPGASTGQMEVLAPSTVVTTPGTFRLTVVDPVRQMSDAFVVASHAGHTAAGSTGLTQTTGRESPDTPRKGPEGPPATLALGPAAASGTRSASGPSPNTVIEDPGAPYRTAIGTLALSFNTTGSYNTAAGYQALLSNTFGSYNTATGVNALVSNTIGNYNTATGMQALSQNRGDYNTANGVNALGSNRDGSDNTATGYAALISNSASWNTATGSNALAANFSGFANTATGYRAMSDGASGIENTATGVEALSRNIASYNTASGSYALFNNTSGSENMASGSRALFSNTTGDQNTASGQYALLNNTTGSRNVAAGQFAGAAATTGSYNVFLGAGVSGTATDTNTMRLGLPYQAAFGVGQNRTFIAGIRGTTVAAGEAVFIDPDGQLGSGPLPPLAANSVGSSHVIDDALTASDLAPGAVGTSELAADAVTAAKVAFPYAASTAEGGPAVDVVCKACVDVSDVGFTFASLGANTFNATQTLAAGNLDLAASSSTAGNLTKNGTRFLHDTGTDNTFLGALAGNFAVTGIANTAGGARALPANTTGEFNVATGAYALLSNTTGSFNTASGAAALENNVTGSANAAYGLSALNHATGSSNTAMGFAAGANATTGTYNVFLGASVFGTAADTNTIRIGLPYDGGTGAGQNRTFIAGIHGTLLTTPAVPVFVDANGQLGTLTPPPVVGTIDGGITPGATPQSDAAALLQRLEDQQRMIADLQARLAVLEADRARGPRRR